MTIAMLRWQGGSSPTSRPSKRIVPAVARSSPATERKVVVLPQPEGPSSTNFSVKMHRCQRSGSLIR